MNKIFTNKQYLTNLSATLAAQLATAISILVLARVLVTNLGEEKFSLYGVVLNLIIVASVFDFSLNTTLVRRLILHPEKNEESINTVFNFFLLVLLIGIPIYFFSFFWGGVQLRDNQWLMAVIVALIVAQNMLAVMFESIMQSVNQWQAGKIIRVFRTIAETGLLYAVSAWGKLEYLLLVTVGVNMVYLVFLALFAKRQVSFTLQLGRLRFSSLYEQLKESFWYFQNTMASVITFNFQIILMSHFLSAAAMTIYLLVFRFFEILRTGLTNFAMLLFPSITAKQKEGNWAEIWQYYKKAWSTVALIVLFSMTLVFVWGDDVFYYWSKNHSEQARHLFFGYGIYVGLLVVDHVNGVFLSALKFNRNTAIVSSLQCILLLFFTYILIRNYGVYGAVYASLCSFICTSLWYNPLHLWKSIRSLLVK